MHVICGRSSLMCKKCIYIRACNHVYVSVIWFELKRIKIVSQNGIEKLLEISHTTAE
jgi:hypothetical protein